MRSLDLVGVCQTAYRCKFGLRENKVANALKLCWRESNCTSIKHVIRAFLAVLLFAIGAGFTSPSAYGQSVTFAGTQISVGSGYIYAPYYVAVAGNGNVYVADLGDDTVKEVQAVNGSIPANPTIRVVGTGFTSPSGVAVDLSGNVYVVDNVNIGNPSNDSSTVKEILAVDGIIPPVPTIVVVASGFNSPFGVAVDGNGNVFVIDIGIKEILAVNGNIPHNPTVITVNSSLKSPAALAVDASGNLYVSDSGNGTANEILAVNGSIPVNPTIRTLASGFNGPYGIAVDQKGNVFVAASDYDGGVKEILAVNGVIPTNPTIDIVGSSLLAPIGIAVARNGIVYVADEYSIVYELQVSGVNLGSENVCLARQTTPAPCSNTMTLNYNLAAGAAIGSVKVLTTGAATLDFQAEVNDVSTTLCSPQTYSSATTCTVDVTFAPLAPGQRKGAVQMLDGQGNVLVNTYIYGYGTGPVIAFSPSKSMTLGGGFLLLADIAVDESGDVFVADYNNSAVKEILAVNGRIPANPTILTLSNNFSPYGVAVDGSGNVFATDSNDNAVKEIVAINGSVPANPTILTLGSGFSSPSGVAVDGSGNVFVADTDNNVVREMLAVNGTVPSTNPTILTLADGFNSPQAVTVDGSGNVFVGDTSSNAVKEIVAVNGAIPANPVILPLGSGFTDATGIAVDASGNVFVSDLNNNTVKEIVAVNGSIPATDPTILTLASSYTALGAAVDGYGDVFVTNVTDNTVQEIERSQPPSLSFASTNVGSTSSDSPQSIHFQNVGNALLSGSGVLSDATDFTVVAGPGVIPDCTLSAVSLAPGVVCDVSFDFTPQSADLLSAKLTLTDNTLNAIGAPLNTQAISVSGTGVAVPPMAQITPTTINFGSVPYPGGSNTQSVMVTNIGGGTLTGIIAVSNGSSVSIINSTCAAGVTAGNNCTFELQFAPLYTNGTHTNTITVSTANGGGGIVKTTGYAGAVVPSTMSLNFGAVSRGGTKTMPLTFSNQGVPNPVTVGYTTGSTSFKVVSNGCTTGISTGNSCTIEIEFAPVSSGAKTSTLKFIPSSGPSYDISLQGTSTP